jgi:D-sedoheptulose 7-phosphate isomerase
MSEIGCHFITLAGAIDHFEATVSHYAPISHEEAFERVQNDVRTATAKGNTIFFIGNGGSAAIASHMAADYCKAGGFRARALNDAATLTCLANDVGYVNVFSQQIAWQAREGDMLVAISSSGKSNNILRAVEAAHSKGCKVVTVSGFAPNNPLRERGDLNFYVASDKYGIVEVAHHAILHAILDLSHASS